MENSEFFALMGLVIQISFGLAFFVLARAGVPAVSRWCAAYIFNAAAILIYALPIEEMSQTLIADAFFLASFYFFGEALLIRYGGPMLVGQRLTLVVLAWCVDFYVVVAYQSLSLSVLVIDIAIALVLLRALLAVWPLMTKGIDVALGMFAALSILNNTIMALVFGLILPTTSALSEFLVSDYSTMMQFAGGVFAIWFGLAALAAVSLDALAVYQCAADQDPLTGLLNRRGFSSAIRPQPDRMYSSVLLNVDIDHFKTINDQYGHDAGDLVLIGMADLLRAAVPADAIIARFGGEEFVIVLHGLSIAEGGAIAHSIRLASAAADWRAAGVHRPITVCVGVSVIAAGDADWRAAYNRADAALYAAKDAGRNQVMFGTTDEYYPISRHIA